MEQVVSQESRVWSNRYAPADMEETHLSPSAYQRLQDELA